tara:strand:- start:104 stop:607 length:504 start_codon:yes stop_codon:yes gene_type:complete
MKFFEKINKLNKLDFITIFGNVFEKNAWIAEKVYDLKPFKNFNDLQAKMMDQYNNCNDEKILEILNAHPELAVEKILTKESNEEQSSAKLNQCSNEEFEEFKMLNLEYKKKFGFPFIIAVSGLNKNQILKNFRERIKKNNEQEFKEAKLQVKNIGKLRLNQILEKHL